MLIASDPQFPWWRGGLFDPDCFNTSTMKGDTDCEDAKGYQSNREMVAAMRSVTDLGSWPTNGLRIGAGNPVTKPAGVIVNGDLTAYGHPNQHDAYNALYKSQLAAVGYQVFSGLGNHDYENNTTAHNGDCYYSDWNWADENRCAKESVWRMASAIHRMPNIVNKDVPGRIAVKNEGGYVAYFHGTYWINGQEYEFETDTFSAGYWGQVVLPPQAAEIDFYVEAVAGGTSEKQHLSVSSDACYAVDGTVWDPGIASGACPHEWPNGSSGSLAYAFEIGNYHFVQLHNHPGYAVSLPYTEITGIDFDHSNGFEITPSWEWLANDLATATSRGKRIVLNMHDEGDLPESETNALRQIIRDKNVVALFVGHLHERFGILNRVKKGDEKQPIFYTYEGNYGTVPVIYSGSSECKTFVLADFHKDYFNVGIVSAQNGASSFITTPRACDNRPLWYHNEATNTWSQPSDSELNPYRNMDVDKTIASYSFNRAPQELNITQIGIAKEGSLVSFQAHASDPEGDPLTYTWNFGDGTTGVGEGKQHMYRDSGAYPVTVVAQDPPLPGASAGNQTSITQVITVANVAPTATLTRASGPVYAGIPVTMTFTNQADASPSDLAAGFTYTYSCQSDTPPVTRANGPVFTCTFASEGLTNIAAAIHDKDGGSTTYNLEFSVLPPAPTAVDDAAETNEDQAVAINVLANDSDPQRAALQVTLVTPPSHGQAVLQADKTFIYTPTADFNGSDSFSYKASNGLDSNVATVQIAVNSVDDPATIALAAGGQCALENEPAATLGLSLADLDTSVDSLTVSASSSNEALLPASSIVISGTGASRTLSISALPQQHGQATITIAVSDGHSQTTLSLNLLVGTTGADNLTGGDGADIIFGLQGNDTIAGLGGADLLCGNDGSDMIDGGDGDDAAYGGDSNDTLAGGAGADMLDGGKGDDALDGGAGDDTLLGWSGRDTLSGGDGNDMLTGGNSNDMLDGGTGDDALDGGKGDDRLTGGLGADAFYSSPGRDQEIDFDAELGDSHPSTTSLALRSLIERQDTEHDPVQ